MSEDDPRKEDTQLRSLMPFLTYVAIAQRVGSVKSLKDELAEVGHETSLDAEKAKSFEAATQELFRKRKAEGKMPVAQRGGRFIAGSGGGGGGDTLWKRMGLGGR